MNTEKWLRFDCCHGLLVVENTERVTELTGKQPRVKRSKRVSLSIFSTANSIQGAGDYPTYQWENGGAHHRSTILSIFSLFKIISQIFKLCIQKESRVGVLHYSCGYLTRVGAFCTLIWTFSFSPVIVPLLISPFLLLVGTFCFVFCWHLTFFVEYIQYCQVAAEVVV